MSGDPEDLPEPETAEPDTAEPGDDPALTDDSGGGGWMDRLMATEPETPIDKVAADHGLTRGQAHVVRGVMKLGGAGGMPAVADLLLGVILTALEQNESGEGAGEGLSQAVTDE